MSSCPFATLVFFLPYPILRKCIFVIKDHRTTWILCNNPTSRATSRWYTFMCFPQYVIAPLIGMIQRDVVSGLFFGARLSSTLLAKEIDKKYPYQRAIGLCHLLTFGPLFAWLLTEGYWSGGDKSKTRNGDALDTLRGSFLWLQMRVTAICLFLDARDVFFQLLGYPYPCYIREAAIAGKFKVKGEDGKMDPRALKPVTWWSRIVGP